MQSHYALDKANGKLMGVCAGLANRTGIDVFIIRLAAVALTLFALGPVAFLIYLLVGLFADRA